MKVSNGGGVSHAYERRASYGSSSVGAPPKGAVSRDKGAMIKLSERTYARIKKSIAQVGLCISLDTHLPADCCICQRNTTKVLKWQEVEATKDTWCLCEYHQRKVGVLW